MLEGVETAFPILRNYIVETNIKIKDEEYEVAGVKDIIIYGYVACFAIFFGVV
jgi:hypothetical protein